MIRKWCFSSKIERLDDLREIIGNDEIDEEMREGIRQEFDEMKTAYPNVWNNPPPRKYITISRATYVTYGM